MNLAPIVLFCYNRPIHVEKTLEALMDNDLADESCLYIYCDGPKVAATPEQLEKIKQTRLIVRKKQWCKEVYIIESSKNKGLANSVIEGVTQVILQHGKVIVLEDDLVTSSFFLKYMNDALSYYENFQSVFSISANRPPANKMTIPDDYQYDVFVSLRNYCTGWGTWLDRWQQVDWELKDFENFLANSQMVKAYNRGGDDLTSMMLLQQHGKIDSWALRFGYSHFVHHAVSILPCVSYIDNIGFDGTGVHSGVNTTCLYRNQIDLALKDVKFLPVIYEDSRIINAFYNVFCSKRRSIIKKGCNWICRHLKQKPMFVIKKKIYS